MEQIGLFTLTGAHGCFLSISRDAPHPLLATSRTVTTHELFRLVAHAEDGSISIQSYSSSLFVTAHAPPHKLVTCNRDVTLAWERFHVCAYQRDAKGESVTCCLQTAHSTFLCVVPPDHKHPHVTQAAKTNEWERIKLTPLLNNEETIARLEALAVPLARTRLKLSTS